MGAAGSFMGTSLSLAECRLLAGSNLNEKVYQMYSDSSGLSRETFIKLSQIQYDVFLSHDLGMFNENTGTYSNHERVLQIKNALEENNIKAWMETPMSGNNLNQVIEIIEKCQLVLVFLTEKYQSKVLGEFGDEDSCKNEYDFSIKNKTTKFMIPVVLEHSMTKIRHWKGALSTLAVVLYVDFVDKNKFEESLLALISSIKYKIVLLHEWKTEFDPDGIPPFSHLDSLGNITTMSRASFLPRNSTSTSPTDANPSTSEPALVERKHIKKTKRHSSVKPEIRGSIRNSFDNKNPTIVPISNNSSDIKSKEVELPSSNALSDGIISSDLTAKQIMELAESHTTSLPVDNTPDDIDVSADNNIPASILSTGETSTEPSVKGNIDPTVDITTAHEERNITEKSSSNPYEFTEPCVVLSGHMDTICCLFVASNGDIFSGSDDRTIRQWRKNGNKYDTLRVFRGHTGTVRCMVMMPNDVLVSGSYERTLRVWDTKQAQCLRTLSGHEDWVYGLCVLNEDSIVSASSDKTLRVWRISDGVLMKTINTVNGLWSVAMVDEDRVVAGDDKGVVRIYTLSSKHMDIELKGHTTYVNDVVKGFSDELISVSYDGTIRIWSGPNYSSVKVVNEGGGIYGVVMLSDGVFATSNYATGNTTIWSAENEFIHPIRVFEEKSPRRCVALGPEGELVTGGLDNRIRVWRP